MVGFLPPRACGQEHFYLDDYLNNYLDPYAIRYTRMFFADFEENYLKISIEDHLKVSKEDHSKISIEDHPKDTNGDHPKDTNEDHFNAKLRKQTTLRSLLSRWRAVIFSGSALCLALFVSGYLMYEYTHLHPTIVELQGARTGNRSQRAFVCIPCDKLQRNPDVDNDTEPLLQKLDIEVDDQGRNNCCAYTVEQKSALLETIMMRQELLPTPITRFSVSEFRFSPVSAHMRLFLDKHRNVERPRVMKLKPNATDARYGLEHHRNVRVSRHGLGIVHPGLYYVYSGVQFKPKSDMPCHKYKYQTFSSFVEKVSYRMHGIESLLKSVHSCCNECVDVDGTQYIGGIFFLERNDTIRVSLYGENLNEFTPETSYLGLAMLGGPDLKDDQPVTDKFK